MNVRVQTVTKMSSELLDSAEEASIVSADPVAATNAMTTTGSDAVGREEETCSYAATPVIEASRLPNCNPNLQVINEDASLENRCQLRDTVQSTALDVLGRASHQHQNWCDDNDALLAKKNRLHKAYVNRPTAANKTAFY
ncbi:unnamed protein product [Schistocephalus solidus]|uniref:Uncharacterized protein n=1 Tax=Schistocephalus solidus TaxID=70667 RepID=A0A183SQ02_SCHSO|nr:unnamed protein product [Schistocephalus solidus]